MLGKSQREKQSFFCQKKFNSKVNYMDTCAFRLDKTVLCLQKMTENFIKMDKRNLRQINHYTAL